ncbi:unnamed protein product [Closterium sp. NIES-53]
MRRQEARVRRGEEEEGEGDERWDGEVGVEGLLKKRWKRKRTGRPPKKRVGTVGAGGSGGATAVQGTGKKRGRKKKQSGEAAGGAGGGGEGGGGEGGGEVGGESGRETGPESGRESGRESGKEGGKKKQQRKQYQGVLVTWKLALISLARARQDLPHSAVKRAVQARYGVDTSRTVIADYMAREDKVRWQAQVMRDAYREGREVLPKMKQYTKFMRLEKAVSDAMKKALADLDKGEAQGSGRGTAAQRGVLGGGVRMGFQGAGEERDEEEEEEEAGLPRQIMVHPEAVVEYANKVAPLFGFPPSR